MKRALLLLCLCMLFPGSVSASTKQVDRLAETAKRIEKKIQQSRSAESAAFLQRERACFLRASNKKSFDQDAFLQTYWLSVGAHVSAHSPLQKMLGHKRKNLDQRSLLWFRNWKLMMRTLRDPSLQNFSICPLASAWKEAGHVGISELVDTIYGKDFVIRAVHKIEARRIANEMLFSWQRVPKHNRSLQVILRPYGLFALPT